MGKQWKQWQTLFSSVTKKQMATAAMKLKDAYSLEEVLWQTWQHIKKQRHHFVNKACWTPKNWCFWTMWLEKTLESPFVSQLSLWSHSHIRTYYQKVHSFAYMDLCWQNDISAFQIVVLEKTLESPLGCKEIKPVNHKGNQTWIFIGRTDAEAEAPILWPPNAKSWLIGKDPDAGKNWGQEEKGVTEDEMVGWHHRLNGHEFEQAP